MIVYVGNHLFYFDEALKQGVICGGTFWTPFSSATFPRDAKGVVSIHPLALYYTKPHTWIGYVVYESVFHSVLDGVSFWYTILFDGFPLKVPRGSRFATPLLFTTQNHSPNLGRWLDGNSCRRESRHRQTTSLNQRTGLPVKNIIIIYHTIICSIDGLKGQKLIAQGIALWYYAQCDSFALQGQKL